MLSLHPFVPAAPCEGTNNILTQQFENHILAKKNLGINGLISPQKIHVFIKMFF